MRKKIFYAALLAMILTACSASSKNLQKKQDKDPNYQYNLGVFYMNDGQLDKAVQYLNRSLALKADNYLAYHSLGLVYSIKGEIEKAVENFQKALSLNPNSTETRNTLGAIYQEMGFLDKAEQEFKAAAQDVNYKSRELPYYNLARLYAQKNQMDTAMENINKSLAFNSSFAMGHNLKGILLEREGQYDFAIDSYRRAINKAPDDISFNYNLAVAYFKNQEYKQAKEIFDKILPRITDSDVRQKIQEYLDHIDKIK